MEKQRERTREKVYKRVYGPAGGAQIVCIHVVYSYICRCCGCGGRGGSSSSSSFFRFCKSFITAAAGLRQLSSARGRGGELYVHKEVSHHNMNSERRIKHTCVYKKRKSKKKKVYKVLRDVFSDEGLTFKNE